MVRSIREGDFESHWMHSSDVVCWNFYLSLYLWRCTSVFRTFFTDNHPMPPWPVWTPGTMDPAARPSLSSTRRRMDPCKFYFYPWFSHYWKMNVSNPIKLQGHWCGQPGRGLPVPLHHAEPVAAVPAGGQPQVSNAAKILFFFLQIFLKFFKYSSTSLLAIK